MENVQERLRVAHEPLEESDFCFCRLFMRRSGRLRRVFAGSAHNAVVACRRVSILAQFAALERLAGSDRGLQGVCLADQFR